MNMDKDMDQKDFGIKIKCVQEHISLELLVFYVGRNPV